LAQLLLLCSIGILSADGMTHSEQKLHMTVTTVSAAVESEKAKLDTFVDQ